MTASRSPLVPGRLGEEGEIDYGAPVRDGFDDLSRDRIPVRSLRRDDLAALARIDRKNTGRDRSAYIAHQLAEAFDHSGIRVSLVAELDGAAVGFVMARVDFGEFGRLEPAAVIDTIGVDPGHARRGVGRAMLSQLLANLGNLRIETLRTEVDWHDFGLIGFLYRRGFRPSQRLAFTRRLD